MQACVPDLLREALNCLDQVNDADGTVRRMKSKVSTHLLGQPLLGHGVLFEIHYQCLLLACSEAFIQG